MLNRFLLGGLGVAVVVAAACSDSSSGSTTSPTTPTTSNSSVTCTSPLTLSVGQVMSGLTGSSFCVTGAAGTAEYALIPFNGSTVDGTAAFNVVAAGTASPSAFPDLIASTGASLNTIPTSGGLGLSTTAKYQRSTSFDLALRTRERTALTPLIPAARSWARAQSSSHARLDAIPSTVAVGQYITLNANANDPCDTPTYRAGRVVAITNRAIIVADTLNPAGGYTDAEYASFGVTFDTLIDPLDRQAFGDVSDIDHNGHVVLFFTKTVNDLTPVGSASYIGGFFFARDLFPIAGTPDLQACATSNVGEMFYIMVPDPNRGGVFAKANVATEVFGTLVHEYQHLINASRRMYVNTAATDFEETWLDEGLAHTAEELLFFRVSGLTPRQNLSAATLRTSQAYVDAFNNYDGANFGRYSEYLNSPSAYSAYADNDSLATRGAIWAFLRYGADHLAASDGNTWFQLVNSTTTGIANLQNVFGANVVNEIRDWGVSVLTDDMTSVSAQYQQPTWNFRSMFAALTNATIFPITYVGLSAGSHAVSLVRGANAYLRFDVAAGTSASVTWSGQPTTVQFTLVRTQ